MKRLLHRLVSLSVAVLALLVLLALPRAGRADVTFSWFYDSLAPYGEWVELDDYGYCWMPKETLPGPNGEPSDWRPYTDGYWSYTDAGWTWVSYEDFGDIVYHYGRWLYLEGDGWAWVPDYEWGPAWVSWQQDDEYIGWAPLPPEAEFDDETGIGEWADRDYDIGPEFYTFCEIAYFGEPVLRPHLRPWRENVFLFERTRNVTNITYVTIDNRRVVFNGGLDFAFVSRHSRRPVERLWLRRQLDGDWAHRARPERSRRDGNLLYINAPVVSGQRLSARIDFAKTRPGRPHGGPALQPPKAANTPKYGIGNARPPVPVPAPKVARQIRQPKVDTGWRGTNPAQREQLRQRTRRQTEGKTRANAPAKKVNEAQVQTLLKEPRPTPPATTRPEKPAANPEKGPRPVTRPDATRPGADRPVVTRPEIARPGADRPGIVRPDRGQRPGRGPSSPAVDAPAPAPRPAAPAPSAQVAPDAPAAPSRRPPDSRPEHSQANPAARPSRPQPEAQGPSRGSSSDQEEQGRRGRGMRR